MTHTDGYKDGQYVICGGSDQYWIKTTAKTLTGAKRIATATYQVATGGKIEIAQVDTKREEFVRVAVKYGYDKWQDVV